MKKHFFFFLLSFITIWSGEARAQQLAASLDSLAATFEIKNKKALRVQPNTATAREFAQKNTADLLFILDNFFSGSQYQKGKSIKTTQYFINANLSKDGVLADSFQSVVYILDIPGAVSYHKYLKADTFLKIQSRPTKVPEQFYISCLDVDRIILISVIAPLYRDAALAAQRQKNVVAYLDWLQRRYK